MVTKAKELTEQRVREIVKEEIDNMKPDIDKIGNAIADKLRTSSDWAKYFKE